MDHETVLNTILANTCPSYSQDFGGLRMFVYDMCCNKVVIIARVTSLEPEIKYEIDSFKIIKPCESEYDCEEVKTLLETVG